MKEGVIMFKHFFKKSNDDDIFETVDPIVEQRRNESFLNHLFMTKNLKKKKLLKKVKVNKYQKKLLPKMLKRLKKK